MIDPLMNLYSIDLVLSVDRQQPFMFVLYAAYVNILHVLESDNGHMIGIS